MTQDFPDFLDDYFAECDEHLAGVRGLLLALEGSVVGLISTGPYSTNCSAISIR